MSDKSEDSMAFSSSETMSQLSEPGSDTHQSRAYLKSKCTFSPNLIFRISDPGQNESGESRSQSLTFVPPNSELRAETVCQTAI